IITAEDAKTMHDKVQDDLQAIYNSLEENSVSEDETEINMPEVLEQNIDDYETAVPLETLVKLNEDLLKRPEGFNQFKRLNRVFKRRQDILKKDGKANWGEGEALAFASILNDGIPIRLTGQDSERGTFAHRHLVLYDTETGERYSPMHGIKGVETTFDIHNSPLSEAAVLGFEY